MAVGNRPKFSYGSGPTALTLTWPARPWTPSRPSVGGVAWSAAGVPASYQVRIDGDLILVLRVTEAELPAVYAWIEAVRSPMETFTFWPDADTAGTSYTVYLAHPAVGEDIPLQRQQHPDDGAVFDLTVTLRKVDGSAWTDAYYP